MRKIFNIQKTKKHQLKLSFYISYIKYFLKKYKKLNWEWYLYINSFTINEYIDYLY